MKYNLAIAALTALTSLTFAQKIKVNPGPVLSPKEIMQLMASSASKSNVSVKLRSSSFAVGQFFDNVSNKTCSYIGASGGQLQFVVSDEFVKPSYSKSLSTELLKDGDKESIQLVSLTVHHGKLFIFYTLDFSKSDQFSLYVNEVSKDFVMMGSPILVHSYKDLKKYGHALGLLAAKNEQNFLVYRDVETKPREAQKFECTVLDSSFGEVWSKPFELEIKDKDLKIRQVDIDNNANVFVLAEKEAKPDSGPVLYFYGWKEKVFKSVDLGLAEGSNFGVKLEIVGGDKPYLIGLNQKKKDISCFVDLFDSSSATLQHLGSTAMPEDFYKASNYGAFETEHWGVSNVVSLENKDIVASIEARLALIRNGIPVAYFSYYTFLSVFTADGKPKLQHTIYKLQSGANELIGAALVPYKNSLLAIYNDHPSNLKLKPTDKKVEKYTGMKEAAIVVQQIGEDGKISKHEFTADPQLKNWSINLDALAKIQDGKFYATGLNRKSMFSFETRALTFDLE